MVYLSNVCEKDPNKLMTITHNAAMYSGPCLNQKLASTLLHMRFDKELLCFDIVKAFNNIALNDVDQNRLLFLWFRNVSKKDFSIVAYKNLRLPFGLKCSPALLMLSLYKLLVLDDSPSQEIEYMKKLIYSLTYMDNCSVSYNSEKELENAYGQLESIFSKYCFPLQQFITNNSSLQSKIDSETGVETPDQVKLLGMLWNRSDDSLSNKAIDLDGNADTKRTILSSLASQFDLFNFNIPLLNRARLFMHQLQCNKDLSWDEKLSPPLIREWRNVARQANSAPIIKIKRFVGQRDESYRLLAFCDSSRDIFGVVVYVQNLQTKSVNFLFAKNKIVNTQLSTKSIPSLELCSIAFAVECMSDLFNELSGSACLIPIQITEMVIYSDSIAALSWIHNYCIKLSKMQKIAIFVKNRLKRISDLCKIHPFKFSFIPGSENPGDCVTRPLSHRQLAKTCYVDGPKFLDDDDSDNAMPGLLEFRVPNPLIERDEFEQDVALLATDANAQSQLDITGSLQRVSSFSKIVGVFKIVLTFIHRLKNKIRKVPDSQNVDISQDLHNDAYAHIIRLDQHKSFPEVFEFFGKLSPNNNEIPNLVSQLNCYVDNVSIIRVRSKFGREYKNVQYNCPILLCKSSRLTELIVEECHRKLSHGGCYSVISELRKTIYIPQIFSTVKKILKNCVHCRRINSRTLKVNQNAYRELRVDPPKVPFRAIYIDYIGPFYAKFSNEKRKVYILCITCMYTRAINLKVCIDMSLREFLRSFQLHCFEFGVPSYCTCDLGSQLVAGANVIMDFIKAPDAQKYFSENNVKALQFEHYAKGRPQLGSLVETCVKLTKRLLYGAIKNNVITFREFEFTVAHTVNLVNRRPIAFRETLREDSDTACPVPITPESLIRGYEPLSMNIIPSLQNTPGDHGDVDWVPESNASNVRDDYSKMRKIRAALIDIYNGEFLSTLIKQAVDVKDRYKPHRHEHLSIGDVVLLKEPFQKPSNYPMGVITKVNKNDNDEVTSAVIRKGGTRESVKRHATTIIPLLSCSQMSDNSQDLLRDRDVTIKNSDVDDGEANVRKKRTAAVKCLQRMRENV